MKSKELKATLQKSYYKKAYELSDGRNVFLQSYDTIVCGIIDGQLIRYWDGYSVTTMKHINDFCMEYGFPCMTKKQWESVSMERCPVSRWDHVSANMGNQWYGYPRY